MPRCKPDLPISRRRGPGVEVLAEDYPTSVEVLAEDYPSVEVLGEMPFIVIF